MKAFGLPSWSLAGLAADNMGVGIGGQGLGSMMGIGGWVGVGVEKMDERSRENG